MGIAADRKQRKKKKETSSFLFLVVRPGATSRVLAPSSDALCYPEVVEGDHVETIPFKHEFVALVRECNDAG